MKRLVLGLATLATACSADTYDLGRTVTDYGFGSPRWAISFGGSTASGSGLDGTTGVAIDPFGDVLDIGTFWDQVDFGGAPVPFKPGGSAAYLTKRSGSDGSEMWTISAGTGAYEDVQFDAVATDSDGNVIVAGAYHDRSGASVGGVALPDSDGMIFVAKLDRSGNTMWVSSLSPQTDPSGQAFLDAHMAVAADGRIFLASSFAGTVVFPNATFTTGDWTNGSAGLVAALDTDGTVLWARAFLGAGSQSGSALTAMPNGDVVAVGSLGLQGTFEGPPLVRPVTAAEKTEWIARLDRDGHLVWQRVLDVPGSQTSIGPVTSRSDGTIAVSFATQLATDSPTIPNAALLDASGTTMWTSAAPDHPIPGGGSFAALVPGDDTILIMAGDTTTGEVDLGNGATLTSSFLAAYDPSGASGTLPAEQSICPATATDCDVSSIAGSSINGFALGINIQGGTHFGNGASVTYGQVAIMMLEP